MPSRRWKNSERLAIWAILLAACLAYGGSLTGPFVFDDVPAIVENPTLRHPGRLGGILAPPGDEAGTVGGRPLVNLSLAVNYAIGGTKVRGYHVVNVLIHVLASLTLFGIVRRTLRGNETLLAFAVALIWAVHPLQTEAVTYVIQRAESLMGLLYLLTVYCFIRYSEGDGETKAWRLVPPAPSRAPAGGISSGLGFASPSPRSALRPLRSGSGSRHAFASTSWAVLSFLCCLFGMATKEVMVSAPLIVFLYDRTFAAGSFREAWRLRRNFYLALGATWILLAILVAGTHGRGGSAGFGAPAKVWPYLLTQCRAVVMYVRLAFWPRPLVFDYGTGLVGEPGVVLPDILVLALLFAGTIWALRRRPALGFLGAWFFAILAPSSSFVPIATEPVAEHRIYLPLAAVIALAVAAGYGAMVRFVGRLAPATFCAVILAAALGLGAATFSRNRVYRSDVTLWADTVAKMPDNPRAHNDLGSALRAQGKGAEAAAEFAAAVRVQPSYGPAQYNLGVTLLDSGQPAEALPHLERALSEPRHRAELQLYLGEALDRLGRPAEAEQHEREALRLAPSSPDAASALGDSLAAAGRYGEAAEAFRLAVRGAPDRARLRNNLANALLLSGQVDAAVDEYRAALRLSPGDRAIEENLARALFRRDSAQP